MNCATTFKRSTQYKVASHTKAKHRMSKHSQHNQQQTDTAQVLLLIMLVALNNDYMDPKC